jgi:DNA-binding MarR family transcriptional regulator
MRQRGSCLVQSADGASPPRGEGDSGGAELADVISRLRRAMRRAARSADPGGNLSVAQLELLSCLAENPGARPGQLARMLRIAPSSEATLASGLRRAGLITRSGGENDRRTASLSLTEAGEAAVSRWQQINERLLRSALTQLPSASRDVVASALPALRDLAGLIDALADALPAGPTEPPPP